VVFILYEHELFHAIHQLSRQFIKQKNEVLKQFGLYSAQWSVLYVLKKKGALTQTELCEYLSVEAPPMTRTIKRLLTQGYVDQISGIDKRTKRIRLTEKAIEEFPKWEQSIQQHNESLLKKFPKSSQDELYLLISGWLHQL
jgi:MarR family transcriptional regulator, transcriptional regulator for hemolysin